MGKSSAESFLTELGPVFQALMKKEGKFEDAQG